MTDDRSWLRGGMVQLPQTDEDPPVWVQAARVIFIEPSSRHASECFVNMTLDRCVHIALGADEVAARVAAGLTAPPMPAPKALVTIPFGRRSHRPPVTISPRDVSSIRTDERNVVPEKDLDADGMVPPNWESTSMEKATIVEIHMKNGKTYNTFLPYEQVTALLGVDL